MKRVSVIAIPVLLLAWFVRLENLSLLATQADEGVHVAVASLVNRHDLRIYGDLFENRTPGVEWLLAAWFRLVDAHIFSARILTVGVTLLTGALLFAIAKRLASNVAQTRAEVVFAGVLAAVLFLFAPLSIFWSRFVMLEHFSTAAAVASIAIAGASVQDNRGGGWFAAGLLAGLAVAFKQSELALLGAMFAFFILQSRAGRKRGVSRAFWSWIAGFSVVVAVLLSAIAAQGALLPFLRFASASGQLGPLANLEAKAAELLSWSLRRPHPWLLLAAIGFMVRRGHAVHQLAIVWFLAEAAFLFLPSVIDLQPGGFSHYVIPVLASASVLAPLGPLVLWHGLERRRQLRPLAITVLLVGLPVVTVPWLTDAFSATFSHDYPQATVAQETRIGRAAQMLTPPTESLLVFGNAILYFHAQRAPASRFFHWPDFLAQSPLGQSAISDVTSSLKESRPATVLVSRLHLQERLPADVQSALWQDWVPVAMFPYAYQGDVFLFVPRSESPTGASRLAHFGEQIELLHISTERLGAQDLLVHLWWRAEAPPASDYTVFVHLLSPESELLAQDDSVPAVGFRPTMTWRAGEAVLDYHWLHIPEGVSPDDVTLSIGLYEPSSGERLPLTTESSDENAYQQPLQLSH